MLAASGGGGGAVSPYAMSKAMVDGMANFKKAGSSGSFAISAEGGKALIQAFDEMTDWVNHNLGNLQKLVQEPQLGNSDGASTVKPYVAEVASDQRGFLTMLMQFKEALANGKQGVQAAMANYQSDDDTAARSFH